MNLTTVLRRRLRSDEGFTLIELLVVIIIIGILAAIAIPVFLSQRQKGYDAQAKSDARNLATLEETYMTDNNHYVHLAAATTAAAVQAVLADYKPSSAVTGWTIKTYKDASHGAAAADDSDAVGGFCVQTTSSSGHTFAYDSINGGLRPGTSATCP